jgi:hypothetical protein
MGIEDEGGETAIKIAKAQQDILGYQARRDAQMRSSRSGILTPTARQYTQDIDVLNNYISYLLEQPQQNQNRIPKPNKPVVNPRGDSRPGQPPLEPDQQKLKKGQLKSFTPSRRKVIEQARKIQLKRKTTQSLGRIPMPRHHPYQVNYYAPYVREQIPEGGVYKAIE